MRIIIILFIACLTKNAFSQKLHLCFKSTDSAYAEDPLKLSFNVIDNDWANGFVHYKGQNGGLLLTFSAEKILVKGEDVNPAQVEYSFNEYTNGKISGKYYLAITGSQVSYFYYYDKRRKAKINFEQDFSNSTKCDCDW